MTKKNDYSSLRQQLADFARQFDESARAKMPGSELKEGSSWLKTLLANLRDLFTRDVTSEGIKNLLQHDARDTLHYFTRGLDLSALDPLPWPKRLPAKSWKVFLALAYRLTPPRRIVFAVAILSMLVGFVQALSFSIRMQDNHAIGISNGSGSFWWLLSCAIVLLLLFMELRDKLDLKSDLEVARDIQFGLVPSEPLQEGVISIHCHMRPANTVGGDYFDIIELEDHHYAIVVGDVAGKGMPAALLMALLQGSLRTLISAGFRGVDLITKLNEHLVKNTPSNSLITLFYAELQTTTGEFRYVNAGHNYPFLLRRLRPDERLASNSIVLGITREALFIETPVLLEVGDRVVLFTDGISEAFNAQDEEFGETRMAAFLGRNRLMPPGELIQGVLAEALRFCGEKRPTDDITLMVIDRH
jgi:hypothetical protein